MAEFTLRARKVHPQMLAEFTRGRRLRRGEAVEFIATRRYAPRRQAQSRAAPLGFTARQTIAGNGCAPKQRKTVTLSGSGAKTLKNSGAIVLRCGNWRSVTR